MRKLDRLGWAEGLAFTAFGVRVGVRLNVSGMLPGILPLLPPGWKKSRGAKVQRLYSLVMPAGNERAGIRRLHVLYADALRLAREAALDQVLSALEADLHLYTATASPDSTFLHAGVVGWKGCAILIPGSSFTGKTTLVREMLRLGATYYSDEFAVVDDLGLVNPFARPLGIRQNGSDVQSKQSAEKFGAATGVRPLPVALAVICQYQQEAQWRPTALSRGQGVLELLANSVAVRSQPRKTLIRLHKLAKRARFFTGTRGEARRVASLILNLADESGRLEAA